LAAIVGCFGFAGHLSSASAAVTTKPTECQGPNAITIKKVTVNGTEVPWAQHLNGTVTPSNPGNGTVKTGDKISVTFRGKEACKQYFTGSGQTSSWLWGAPSDNDSVHFYAFEAPRFFLSKPDGAPVVQPFEDIAAPQKLVQHGKVKYDTTQDLTLALSAPSCNYQIDLVPGTYEEGSWTAMDVNGGMENGTEKTCPTAKPVSVTKPITPVVQGQAITPQLAETGIETSEMLALGFLLMGIGGSFMMARRNLSFRRY